jgi:hypothetical protein
VGFSAWKPSRYHIIKQLLLNWFRQLLFHADLLPRFSVAFDGLSYTEDRDLDADLFWWARKHLTDMKESSFEDNHKRESPGLLG